MQNFTNAQKHFFATGEIRSGQTIPALRGSGALTPAGAEPATEEHVFREFVLSDETLEKIRHKHDRERSEMRRHYGREIDIIMNDGQLLAFFEGDPECRILIKRGFATMLFNGDDKQQLVPVALLDPHYEWRITVARSAGAFLVQEPVPDTRGAFFLLYQEPEDELADEGIPTDPTPTACAAE